MIDFGVNRTDKYKETIKKQTDPKSSVVCLREDKTNTLTIFICRFEMVILNTSMQNFSIRQFA